MPKYFEFEVALKQVTPRIWRRFLLHHKASFMELHKAIQDACGWWDYHLFSFSIGRPYRGEEIASSPNQESGWLGEPSAPDARKVKLADYFHEKGDQCYYLYDFGDDWVHMVKLRKIVDLDERFKRRLLAGKRAFPHEDCGGVYGYQNCLEVFEEKQDDSELKEWLGNWHPETFDLEQTKQQFNL